MKTDEGIDDYIVGAFWISGRLFKEFFGHPDDKEQ